MSLDVKQALAWNDPDQLPSESSSMNWKPGKAIKSLPRDSMLLRCDGLFWLESNGSRKPYVQTLFTGHEVSYVPAELLNMLVPGSTYRNTDRFSSSTSKSFFSKVTTTSGPMRGLSGSYWLELHFEIGPPARIRLHELARVLFFHNAHLFRAATRPDGLSSFASAFIKDGDIIASTYERKCYAIEQKDEFLAEVDGAVDYANAIGWS